MINKKIGHDTAVQDMWEEFGPEAVICHHRLIAFQDRNGNTRVDERFLLSEIFEKNSRIFREDIARMVAGMVKHGLIRVYRVDRSLYANFPKFRDNQVGLEYNREKDECPQYDEKFDVGDEILASANLSRENREVVAEVSRKDRAEVEVEVEVEERKKKTSSSKKESTPTAKNGHIPFNHIAPKVQAFLLAHNKLCDKFPSIPSVDLKQISEKRLKRLVSRMAEPPWDSEAILAAIESMPWYNGTDPKAKWDGASVNWLLQQKDGQPANYELLLEKYHRDVREEENDFPQDILT